jgi:CubicO group peptidase (beta-lactamase class C family)
MTFDRRAALAALAGAALAPAAAAAPAALAAPKKAARSAPKPSGWDGPGKYAQQIVDGHLSPGVSICVSKRGKVIYDRCAGLANIETDTPMTARSVCRIGSITKQFTAAAILLLAEDGKLSIDDALSVYLPEFPRAKDLPLRRILSHTAGLGNYTEEPLPQFFKDVRVERTSAEMVAWMAASHDLQHSEPGTAWRYSNTGYVLLGAVVERASGKSYGDFLNERICKPLGLTQTALDRNTDVVPHRAGGYSIDARSPSGFDRAAFISMTAPGGAGAMRSSTADLCAWHTALFGGKVLKPESLKAMTTPALLNSGEVPTTTGPGGKTAPVHYGFGLFVDEFEGKRLIGHGGGIFGFGSHVETFPDQGVSIAWVRNCDGGPGPSVSKDAVAAVANLDPALRNAALAS